MKVIRAKSAGFCWGVERAIGIAQKHAEDGFNPVYTDGPLIHNKQMMNKLEADGIKEVGDYLSSSKLELKPNDDEPILVVRAHGISPERRNYLKSLGLPFKDATCPDVGIVAGKIKIHAKRKYSTVIFGDKKHPEVIGLMGYTEGRGHVVKSIEDIDALPELGDKIVMVSQTTMFTDEFNKLSNHLKSKYPNLVSIDTICQATKDRQGEVQKLVMNGANALVVIGGHHSANTRKLALLAEKTGLKTYHIETADEIDIESFKSYECVGVTAGASTPDFVIDKVCKELEAI